MNREQQLIIELSKLQGEFIGSLEAILLWGDKIPSSLRMAMEESIEELEKKEIKVVRVDSVKVEKQDFGKEWECVKLKGESTEKEIKVDEKMYILKEYLADLTENYLKRLLMSGKLQISKGFEKEFEHLVK